MNQDKLVNSLYNRLGDNSRKIFDRNSLVDLIDQAINATNFVLNKKVGEREFELVVQYAASLAYRKQALLERGREFPIKDNGIAFTPPTVSNVLLELAHAELRDWHEKIRWAANF